MWQYPAHQKIIPCIPILPKLVALFGTGSFGAVPKGSDEPMRISRQRS